MEEWENKISSYVSVSFIRDYLEGLPCPICTRKVKDTGISKLINEVCDYVLQITGEKFIDLSNEDMDRLWFSELEQWAINVFGMPYYEDMPEQEEDDR